MHLPREIVVKSILLSAFSPSAQSHLKARFRREAYIQSQLDHPNIVRVYEFFAAEDNYYLVMEYVPGMSLRDLLSRQGVPTPAQAVYLCKQALSALDYAHNFSYVDESDLRHTGIIHRDIKPANILLDNKGKLKITDFGIVKVLGEQGTGAGMTQTGFHPGTVEYMSPEQLLGLDIDVRSDLYSLGVTFYEMLSGRLPFERSATGSDWEVRKGHIELTPPPILQYRPDLPPTLAAIIMRSLQKSPNERFQTAAEFLEALQIHDRTVGAETSSRGTTGRLTKPIAPQGTAMDESATLIARPLSASQGSLQPPISIPTGWPSDSSSGSGPSPQGLQKEDALTMPISQSRVSNSANESAQPAQIAARNSNPTNEETIVVPRRSSSKSRLALAAAGLGLLLTGAAGAYFLSGQRNQQSMQNVAVKPDPTVTPTTVAMVNSTASPTPTTKPKVSPTAQAVVAAKPVASTTPPASKRPPDLLTQAKALEDSEHYDEAIAKYSEYQRSNPGAMENGLALSRINILTNVKRLLNQAQADMQAGRYIGAREKYKTALGLKPNSQIARVGFDEAKMKAPYLMNGAGQGFPSSPDRGPNPPGQGRRRKFPNPNPDVPRQP